MCIRIRCLLLGGCSAAHMLYAMHALHTNGYRYSGDEQLHCLVIHCAEPLNEPLLAKANVVTGSSHGLSQCSNSCAPRRRGIVCIVPRDLRL